MGGLDENQAGDRYILRISWNLRKGDCCTADLCSIIPLTCSGKMVERLREAASDLNSNGLQPNSNGPSDT